MALPRYVLDATALAGTFDDVDDLEELVFAAERDLAFLFLPTVAMAETESELHAGTNGWAHLLFTPHVVAMSLAQHTALEMGIWDGPMHARHAAHEAHALDATVVTRQPELYEHLPVTVRVV